MPDRSRSDLEIDDDKFEGGIGRDRLNGNSGDDTIVGGGSIDRFIFNTNEPFSQEDLGTDLIADFSKQQQDKIILDRRTFTVLESEAGEGLDAAEFAFVGNFGVGFDDKTREGWSAILAWGLAIKV